MRIDISFLPALAAAFILVFGRIGSMVMLMPGSGEANLPTRVRLAIALALTLVMLPLHRQAYNIDLTQLTPLTLAMIQEVVIGLVLGIIARLAVSALQTAGFVVAQQLGLGFVTAVDPTQDQQGVLVGNFLALLGVTLIFATDMHHLEIEAMNDSYAIFKPGEMQHTGDVAKHITTIVAASFRIGLQLAAPFIACGILFNIGLGVLSRLMPQMQVFFIGLPLSILLGLLLLVMVLGAMMGTFTSFLRDVLTQLATAG